MRLTTVKLLGAMTALLSGVAGAIAGGALAQTGDVSPVERHARDLALSEKLGRTLYARDTAAYLAGLEIADALGGEAVQAIDGWITVKEGEQYKVLFIDDDGTAPSVLFLAFVLGDSVIDRFAPSGGMPLFGAERAMWRARQDALSRDFMRCADTYNPVVLPYNDAEGAPDGLFVYLVPATAEAGVIKAGGYQLFDYDPDGAALKGEMAFSRNCLDVEKKEEGEGASLILSHSLTPYPQEHQVFLSLLFDTDVFVSTDANGVIWKISDGEISLYRQNR